MAGKNTAVFGIYKSRMQAESAVDKIAAAGFTYNDISVLLPDSQSSKEFAHEKNTKAPEGTTTVPRPEVLLVARSGFWPASEHSPFRASDRSSRQARSWARSQELAPAARLADSSEPCRNGHTRVRSQAL